MKDTAQTRPYVVCHMLTSLDGKIDGAYMSDPACTPALAAYGALRGKFSCRATLYGTTTMAGSYADGYVGPLPKSTEVHPREDYIAAAKAESYIVSADPEGVLQFHSNVIAKKGRPEAHVIEVLTDTVHSDYLSYLRGLGISYIFAGGRNLDCKRMLEKLYRLFAIDKLMLAGGGLMNWSLAREHLIDELSLVIFKLDFRENEVTEAGYESFIGKRQPA